MVLNPINALKLLMRCCDSNLTETLNSAEKELVRSSSKSGLR
ncbi:hypothetical protein SynBIOSE41_01582 [Synechococcus sp. BIOS-E4-1]|nr:hypothetical protein SynBIOSE41_01582 [Synechococcus sp. BIOS-E4-1]